MINNNTQQLPSLQKKENSIPQEIDYTIQDLFFYQEIENGSLLATSKGKLGQQAERAAVFVPSGGGEADSDFSLESSEDDSITLIEVSSGIRLSYYLFNIDNSESALILKYEASRPWKLIFYDGKSNKFQKAIIDNFFEGSDKGKIVQNRNIAISGSSIFFRDLGIRFNWDGSCFIEY